MKKIVKRITAFIILLGLHAPITAYEWIVHNGLGENALIKLNITGATRQAVIPAGGSYTFNGPRSICLTHMYAQTMSDMQMKRASMRSLNRSALKTALIAGGVTLGAGVFFGIGDLGAGVSTLVIGGIVALAIILNRLCRDGQYLIAKDEKGNYYAITYTEDKDKKDDGSKPG